MLLDGFLGI